MDEIKISNEVKNMAQIEVPKETKTIIQSGKPESWVKAILFLLSGAAGNLNSISIKLIK